MCAEIMMAKLLLVCSQRVSVFGVVCLFVCHNTHTLTDCKDHRSSHPASPLRHTQTDTQTDRQTQTSDFEIGRKKERKKQTEWRERTFQLWCVCEWVLVVVVWTVCLFVCFHSNSTPHTHTLSLSLSLSLSLLAHYLIIIPTAFKRALAIFFYFFLLHLLRLAFSSLTFRSHHHKPPQLCSSSCSSSSRSAFLSLKIPPKKASYNKRPKETKKRNREDRLITSSLDHHHPWAKRAPRSMAWHMGMRSLIRGSVGIKPKALAILQAERIIILLMNQQQRAEARPPAMAIMGCCPSLRMGPSCKGPQRPHHHHYRRRRRRCQGKRRSTPCNSGLKGGWPEKWSSNQRHAYPLRTTTTRRNPLHDHWPCKWGVCVCVCSSVTEL